MTGAGTTPQVSRKSAVKASRGARALPVNHSVLVSRFQAHSKRLGLGRAWRRRREAISSLISRRVSRDSRSSPCSRLRSSSIRRRTSVTSFAGATRRSWRKPSTRYCWKKRSCGSKVTTSGSWTATQPKLSARGRPSSSCSRKARRFTWAQIASRSSLAGAGAWKRTMEDAAERNPMRGGDLPSPVVPPQSATPACRVAEAPGADRRRAGKAVERRLTSAGGANKQ